jgi:hypothetical protein
MENILQNEKNAEFWSIEEVSKFIKSIPGCNNLNELFEKEVKYFKMSPVNIRD